MISATKSNAQQHSLTFWDEIFEQVSKEFPEIKPERVLSGYITRGDFWKLGLIFGVILFAGLLIIGLPWLLTIKF